MTQNATEVELLVRVRRLEVVLGTALTWMAQTAGSPLSPEDVRRLLAMLEGKKALPQWPQ